MCTLLTIPAIAICTFASAPCDHVKGAGDVVKKAITVDAFHGIAVEGGIDVVLTPAATQAVEVEAQANLIELVTTEVKNGIWTIGTSKDYSTNKTFTVHISVPVIDKVDIAGSGSVKSEGSFTADKVDLQVEGSGTIALVYEAKSIKAGIAGSGDIKISGACTALDVAVEGSGDMDARDLKSTQAKVATAGSGDVILTASESLDASVAGSGDIEYGGHPAQVNKNVAGSGSVHAIGTHGPL